MEYQLISKLKKFYSCIISKSYNLCFCIVSFIG